MSSRLLPLASSAIFAAACFAPAIAFGQAIRTNVPWSPDAADFLGRNPPHVDSEFSQTLPAHQVERAECEEEERCEPQIERSFNEEGSINITGTAYGWWCGGARPVDGDEARTKGPLDPVDFCCKLHDGGVWSQAALQEDRTACADRLDEERHLIDACGIYMCLTHQVGDWSAFPQATADARDFIAAGFLEICQTGCLVADANYDCDELPNTEDNCPKVANPSQGDADADGTGDACQCGDASGDGFSNTTDARLIQRCTVGAISDPQTCQGLCDVNGDGLCNTTDARLIQRLAVGELEDDHLTCAQRDPRPGANCTGFLTCGNNVCERPAENCGVTALGCAADCGLCDTGRICFDDADCASGICSLGECTKAGSQGNGSACSDDRACASGNCALLVCASRCGNAICEEPAEACGVSLNGCDDDCGLCANGSSCVVDEDCQSDICNNAFQCASCRSNGQACLTSDVCCSGICNNAFQCASCRSNGESCLTSAVCCSGICNSAFECASCKSAGQACSVDGECCSGNCNRLGVCGL